MLSTCTVRISRLSQSERERLRTELIQLHHDLMRGTGLESMVDVMLDTSAGERRLARVYTPERRLVGYYVTFFEDMDVEGRAIRVMRASCALHPDYRGGQRSAWFFLVQALKVMLTQPWRPMYLFAPLAHVSSFRVINKHVSEVFPNPRGANDPELEKIHHAMRQRYGGPRTEGDHPWVCRRLVFVPPSPSPRRRPMGVPDALDRYWSQLMTSQEDGCCLMVVLPVSWRNICSTALVSLRNRLPTWRSTPTRHVARA